ncbi:uncharacterized protein BKA78DRAFT_155459 [Phyllosticta capitalensis]|uniref:uncharacterized protein n=1 Tax=Phyllosticta capitalensis TaxID=121624 RepID=UPI00313014B5
MRIEPTAQCQPTAARVPTTAPQTETTWPDLTAQTDWPSACQFQLPTTTHSLTTRYTLPTYLPACLPVCLPCPAAYLPCTPTFSILLTPSVSSHLCSFADANWNSKSPSSSSLPPPSLPMECRDADEIRPFWRVRFYPSDSGFVHVPISAFVVDEVVSGWSGGGRVDRHEKETVL